MSKYKRLRKNLIFESAVIAGVLTALAGGAFFISSMSDDYRNQRNTISGQIGGLAAQIGQLQAQLTKAQRSMGAYQDLLKRNQNAGFTLSRQDAKTKLETLRDRYRLATMHVNMSPIVDASDAKYQKKTVSMISNTMTLDMDAMSDEDIVAFMDDMEKELSGFVRVTTFSIVKSEKVSNENLLTISQRGTFPMVRGEIKFIWMGIKSLDDGKASIPKPPGGA
jgi:hypothetical protein